MPLKPPMSTLFPYTTLFRSRDRRAGPVLRLDRAGTGAGHPLPRRRSDHGGSSASALSPVAWERIREPGLIWSAPRERSEEHTSELQSRGQLVCRLPLGKKSALVAAARTAPSTGCTQWD